MKCFRLFINWTLTVLSPLLWVLIAVKIWRNENPVRACMIEGKHFFWE